MRFEVGKLYEGFELIEEKKIEEVNSFGRIFKHKRSGAKLFHLENDDDNKVFSITFKTPPKDSTGVAHILEHSVLCGSRKFPSKEPFVELIKGSLNTFLNAMTFSDKTMYPVASRNKKDFYNLMDVYLDAVLYPNIYKYDEIMAQEGWHYEFENEEDELAYKGVVYNEMKGAFSSPEGVLMRKIQESLFPDTAYGVESGGDPDIIPELTQENFRDFHKKYYHPSNSYIYLYGDMDIMEALSFINENYLKDFDTLQVDSDIKIQEGFGKERELVVEYPIATTEKEEDKTFLSLNFTVGRCIDPETYLAFDILEYMLLDITSAPLKKALLDAEIGKDVFGVYDNSILQPYFSVVVKNSNENQKEKFRSIVMDTLNRLVRDGIDKRLIEAAINIKEFNLREADFGGYPKGLVYHIKSMDSWLYGEHPAMHLKYEETLKKIKSALTTDYFEKLIKNNLLNSSHSSLLIVKPAKGIAEKKAENLKKQLAEYKASLSKEELNEIIENTRKLRERQESQDTPEALESIPLLSLEDINPKAEDLPYTEREEKGIKVLYQDLFTSGISYINLYFDSSCVKQEDIPYISLLSSMLGKVDTEKYSYEDLSKEVNIHTGGNEYFVRAYSENGNDEVYYPKFVVKSKALVEKLPKLMELLGEILGHSKFDNEKRLREIVQELKSRMEMAILQSGHRVAAEHVCSYFSPFSWYEESLRGLRFYQFIAGVEKQLKNNSKGISEKLKEVAERIFNKGNLLISTSCEAEGYEKFAETFETLYTNLGDRKSEGCKYNFEASKDNEGLMTSSKVQYAAKAYNYRRLGYSYTGSLQVFKTIASFDYLWNKVRVLGGAYGCMAVFYKNGNLYFSSYRDPNLKETIETYDEIEDYIKNFSASDREMTKYIIGTISELDTPLTPSMKTERAAGRHISHVNTEELQRERDEILKTDTKAINSLAPLVGDCMKQDYICVLGSEEKIKNHKDMFNKLVEVFE